MKNSEFMIVTDFDGTVSARDVGFDFFVHFSGGKNHELVAIWKEGNLTTRECLKQEVSLVSINESEIYPFLDKFEFDPGFEEFESLCNSQNIHLAIVSEGLDFYIDYLLKRRNLGHIARFSNKGKIENNRLEVEFPYDNRDCKDCGNCKAARIEELKNAQGNGCKVVFIGDGYSDACATRAADLIFAKKDLKKYCLKNEIKFHDFDNFFDVAKKLENMGLLK